MHGFDEFFGNLYHLNAEEEPELPDYPKDPKFKEMFGPRGVLDCKATDKDDATVDPRWGRVGKQTIVDTGPLTKKRMETVDEEITARALAWMETQAKADKPFFLWYNSTAMHFRTHVAAKNIGKSGQDPYSDRMVVHDEQIGMMLKKLDELGIADNTIVMYSTDNGPENDTWPDGANTPFRGQKDSNWEGGWRVPCFIRWPGTIKPGSVYNFRHASSRTSTCSRRCWPRPEIRTLLSSSSMAVRWAKRSSTFISTGTIRSRISRARRKKARETRSCTSATTATSSLLE